MINFSLGLCRCGYYSTLAIAFAGDAIVIAVEVAAIAGLTAPNHPARRRKLD